MKIMLITLAVLALVSLYLAYPIRQATKRSETINASAVPFTQTPESPDMRILVLGDSTAVGVGAGDPRYSIAGRLGTRYPHAKIENVSEYGLRLQGLKDMYAALPKERYDLVVLQIGANDITHFTPLESVRTVLSEILDRAELESDKVIVLHSGNVGLVPVFKFPLSEIISHRTRQVREVYMQVVNGRSHTTYIDLYKDRDDEIFNTDPDRYYAPDYFHPSADGYGVWFESIEGALE